MKKTWKWRLAQMIELQWWKNYLKNKPKADYLAWKKDYWQNLLTQAQLPPLNEKKAVVLDAGCGPAGIFMVLTAHQVKAVDPLLSSYETEIPHFSTADYPHVQFENLPLEKLADSNLYDFVFCMNVINHVSELALCMDNLVRAAKAGAYLLLTIDAHNYAVCKQVFRLLPGDVLHPHQYDLTEYKQLLTQRNCSIESCSLIKKTFLFNHYLLVAKVGRDF